MKNCLKKKLITAFLLLFAFTAFSQTGNITVRGLITNMDNEPLIGVSVKLVGSTTGAITDLDGEFVLERVSPNASLEVTYVGMKTQVVSVEGRTTINVVMEDDIAALDEVIVVGYGTQTRGEITGSVVNVSEEEFNKGLTQNVTDLLQGRVAGLMINSASGDVTTTSSMRLRGVTTLMDDPGPLIVIDGIPGGDLSTVSPSDVESISVLKDATSAAIYGSRAAGGVVLVTTKKGRGDRLVINYDAYASMDKLANKPDLMNADEWREYARYSNQDASIYDQYGADTDWFKEITRTGFSQNHNISLSGGGTKNNYRGSYTFQDRKGVMADNAQRRHSFRLQLQQRAIEDRLRVGVTVSTTAVDQKRPEGGNYVLAYSMLPVYPVYNSDGSWFTKVNAEYDQGNPVQNITLNRKDFEMLIFYGSGNILFQIMPELSIQTNLYKSRFSGVSSTFNDSTTEDGQSESGNASKSNNVSNRELMEWMLDYEKEFGINGEHKVTGLIGYSWERNTYSYFLARNRNFLSNALQYNSLQSGMGLKTGDVSSSKNEYTLISLYGRLFYSYKQRYLMTAMLRRDGSSKFGANNKWGLFPSVSLAWLMSEEGFMKDVGWINSLKLRMGYGVTGNETGLQPYRSLQLYGMSGIYYDDGNWKTAYTISQNANPDLKWESTATANLGLDFVLFNGVFGGTLEFYNKKTYDMLYNYAVPTPPFVYDRMTANVGDMINRGVEAIFNVQFLKSRDVDWSMSLNGSYNYNEITRLSDDVYETARIYTGSPWIRGGSGVTSHVVEEGRPVGQFFMWECLGISDDGKYIFNDLNGDGNIDDSDRTYVGTALPKVIFGWNNSVRYKQFDFSVFFRGTLGNDVFNGPRAAYGNNTYLIGTNALNDPLIYQLKGQNSQISSFYVEDASFVRLDNIALGYSFNTNNIPWLSKARVYVAGQNLFVLTKYKGLDPEVRLHGLDPGIENREFYPKAKTFTLGLNLSF